MIIGWWYPVGKVTKPPRPGHRASSAWWRERAGAAFAFLVTDHGFVGPEFHDQGLTYYSPAVNVEVLYDERAQAVETLVCALVGHTYVRARTSCLLVESGLGTTHSLELGLASQASALERILGVVLGDARDGLMRACHAR